MMALVHVYSVLMQYIFVTSHGNLMFYREESKPELITTFQTFVWWCQLEKQQRKTAGHSFDYKNPNNNKL